MSYNSENGIISAPVSIDDVKQALGESSNDLATLCKSYNIDKWSPYKPVDNKKKFDMTDSDYGVTDKSYKLKVPTYNRLEDLAYDLISKSGIDYIDLVNYDYDKPKGGETSPYRLQDFIGYSHNMYKGWHAPTANCKHISGSKSAMSYSLNEYHGTRFINLWDFWIFSNCYFGVGICNKTTGNIRAFVTNANKLQSGYCNASNNDCNYFGNGTFVVFPFITDTAFVNVRYDSANTSPAKFYIIDETKIFEYKLGTAIEDPISSKLQFKLYNKDLDYKDPVSGLITPGAPGKYLSLYNSSSSTTYYNIMIEVRKNNNVVARLNKNMQTIKILPRSDMEYRIEVSEYLKDSGNRFVVVHLGNVVLTLNPNDYPTWGS